MPKLSFQYVRHKRPAETLLEFLTRRFKYHSPSTWEKLIHHGQVTINNHPTSPNHILHTQEHIIYHRPDLPEPSVNTNFRILYQDADLLAVSKSNNIPTSPSGKYWHNCLLHILQHKLNAPSLRAVHRLDRETSGVNLFVFGKENAHILGLAFQKKQIRKTYAAILQGHLKQKRIQVNAPIAKDASSKIHIKQTVSPAGKPSQTNFYPVKLLRHNTLVHIRPHTGRTHQIRVHAAHIGHPILYDKIYAQNEDAFLASLQAIEQPDSHPHQLHALRLQLRHPQTQKWLTIQDAEHQLDA